MALNQLLVVMDGIDDPPLTKRIVTKRLNTFLDALYIVPQRVGPVRLRKKPPKPRKEEIYFIGACNVPLETLDPALTRPGRMGRHIHFRTPTWEDRRDIFDLYITKVAHVDELDTQRKRDELARITSGYSPAMIDQVCSMALTYAHSDGRPVFALGRHRRGHDHGGGRCRHRPGLPVHEERAIAIHEAGHAVCSHLFNENLMSTRLSIRKRGGSGGHHMAMEVEERFVDWRSEMFGRLIHILGAMAAEVVFYGQNTTGVGGDVHSVSRVAGRMVGFAAMAPQRVDLSDRIEDPELREAEEDRVMERFEKLGTQILHRSGGGLDQDPMAAVFGDPSKRPLDHRPARSGLRHRLQHGPPEPRRGRARRRRARGQARDLRRRRRRAARRGRPVQARDRRARRGRMAGDLIPPRSPAGRPEPDSTEKLRREGLWAAGEDGPVPVQAEAAPAPEPERALPESPYRPRFGFITGALIGVAIAVIALGVLVAVDSRPGDARVSDGWSAWAPAAGEDVAIAKQIAEHVGPQYRLGNGSQLVLVTGTGFEVPIADPPLPFDVAVRTAAVGGDIELLEGNGVLYTLNGLGDGGSIPGTPSEERGLLVRREALELALYTFRYADDVDMVVTLLPPLRPKAGEDAAPPAQQAILYRPGDLADRLDVPLAATIPPQTPRPETLALDSPEAQGIAALSNSNEFLAVFRQTQDAHTYLVLDRAPK